MPSFLNKFRGRLQRELSLRSHPRLVTLPANEPIVSFTFDDFPKSALWEAGTILREHNYLGTYYASFGLMGQMAPTGLISSEEDLPEFVRQGHELGCHTFDHYHSWDTQPEVYEASIRRNQEAVRQRLPAMEMENFSYPISGPRPGTKKRLSHFYASARGGGQTYNLGQTDLNFLKAFFIEQSREDLDAIKKMIDETVAHRGWLIFATHDVTSEPTRFGCTPELFRTIVTYVVQSGARVLTVKDALASYGISAARASVQA